MTEQESRKWEGETKVELKAHTPDQIWPLISDFCSLNKWFPHVSTCHLLEGLPGQPGAIRYCASTELPGEGVKWAKERLIMIDQSQKCFSYDIVESNAGFKEYIATVRLVPTTTTTTTDGCDEPDLGGCGCRIVWSFVADPVEGWTMDGLVGFLDSAAQAMAHRLEEALMSQQQQQQHGSAL